MTELKPDPYCPLCNGSGTLIVNEKVDENGDYWCSFVDCDCRSLVARAALAKAREA